MIISETDMLVVRKMYHTVVTFVVSGVFPLFYVAQAAKLT